MATKLSDAESATTLLSEANGLPAGFSVTEIVAMPTITTSSAWPPAPPTAPPPKATSSDDASVSAATTAAVLGGVFGGLALIVLVVLLLHAHQNGHAHATHCPAHEADQGAPF